VGKDRLYAVLKVERRAPHPLILVRVECEERLRQILVPVLELVMFLGRDALEALDELVI